MAVGPGSQRLVRLVAVVLVVAVATGMQASRHAAQSAAGSARADALRLGTLAMAEPRADLALLYAAQAVRLDSSPATRAALLSVLSRSPELIGIEHVPPSAVGPMRNGVLSDDGSRSASVTSNHTVSVWNTTSGRRVEALHGHAAAVRTVQFSADSTVLRSTDETGTVLVWDLVGARRFAERYALPQLAPGTRTTTVARPDGAAVVSVVSRPGATWMRVLNLAGGIGSAPFGMRDSGRISPVWRPDGQRIATADSDGFLRIWDPATGAMLAGHHSVAWTNASPAYTPDGWTILMASRAGSLYRVDAETLELEADPVPVGGRIGAVTAAPRGRLAAVLAAPSGSDDGRLTRWAIVDLAAGEVVRRGSLGFDATAMAFAPDGRRLTVAGGKGEVLLIDLRTGEPVRPTVVGHNASVLSVGYSADGTRIVTGGFDGRVVLWNARTGGRLGALRPGGAGTASRPVFLPDGHTVLIPAEDGSVSRWDARPSSWIERACRIAGRDLTAEEWKSVLGSRPYRETC